MTDTALVFAAIVILLEVVKLGSFIPKSDLDRWPFQLAGGIRLYKGRRYAIAYNPPRGYYVLVPRTGYWNVAFGLRVWTAVVGVAYQPSIKEADTMFRTLVDKPRSYVVTATAEL